MKNLLLISSIALLSSKAVASELEVEVWYEPQVVEKGKIATLHWESKNAVSCGVSGKTAGLRLNGTSPKRHNDFGLRSSKISCKGRDGTTLARNANLYVVHTPPSNAHLQAGGGKAYYESISREIQPHYTQSQCLEVTTYNQLKNCLTPSKNRNKFVSINGRSVIKLRNDEPLIIPEGFTLVSDRGYKGSAGATLYLDRLPTSPNHRALKMAKNTRLSGVRLVGPYKKYPTPPSDRYASGVAIGYDIHHERYRSSKFDNEFIDVTNVTIDNSEFASWFTSSIAIGYKATNVTITNNLIRDNKGKAYGYGVSADGTDINKGANSTIVISKNVFYGNRHDIASSGYHGNSYKAQYNIVFDGLNYEDEIGEANDTADNHRFDVHGCWDRSKAGDSCRFERTTKIEGEPPVYRASDSIASPKVTLPSYFPKTSPLNEVRHFDAGNYYEISNNIFSIKSTRQRAIRFRGTPYYGSKIINNAFSHGELLAKYTAPSERKKNFNSAIELQWHYDDQIADVDGFKLSPHFPSEAVYLDTVNATVSNNKLGY